MTSAQIKSVQCLSPAGLHKMAYKEWGDPANSKVLICVHGLARVSDDFDAVARALSGSYRVVCPDIVGRGRSDRLRNPELYQIPQYVNDLVALIARLNVETVDWLGTSMGGLIGIALASLPGNPVRKLVLNDIGSALNPEALVRIGNYLGLGLTFPTLDEADRYIRSISVTFGTHTDEEWRKFTTDVLRQNPDGTWTTHYDPGISVPFKKLVSEPNRDAELLKNMYEAVRCETLLVRGENSDILSREVAQEMTRCGPKAKLVEIPNVGHAPTFVHDDQIAILREFLLA